MAYGHAWLNAYLVQGGIMQLHGYALALLTFATFSACGGGQPPPETPEPVSEAPTEPVVAAPPPGPKLKLEVVTSSPDGFLVNSTLVTGEKEAVLIDAQFTLADAKKVADAVTASGKKLTTVFVTHFHPDHYFGFVTLAAAFPEAKLVALPATVESVKASWEAKVKQWKPLYKDGITDKPVVPEALTGNTIELEGEKLEIVGELQGDSADNSYVWIPSLSTLVTGDLVYDDVFPWTAETTPAERKAWIESLDKLAALNATKVVPGHQKPEKAQAPASIQFTKDYLIAYDEALAGSKNAADLQSKIKAKYPDAALDIVLKIGAESSFKKPTAKKKKP
jgi:glyoxylase-like metal-dependent hydrolase (beta-lactamase superfamily II)